MLGVSLRASNNKVLNETFSLSTQLNVVPLHLFFSENRRSVISKMFCTHLPMITADTIVLH